MKYKINIAPLSEREELIAKRLESAESNGDTLYDFRNENQKLKVIKLDIDVPVYRLENCRTFSAQQSAIATNGYEQDHFEKGQEKSTVQQAQHGILADLAKRGTRSVTPIVDVLDKEGQRQSILISSTGVVVNGNRRLSAMRELYRKSDGSVDGRFSHVKCAVLPPDITPDEIDEIEGDLQARPQTQLDYDWIGDARLIRRQVNKKGNTVKQVADRYRRSKAELENVLQSLDEADLYLGQWLGKPGQYDLINADGVQIFRDIPKQIAKQSPDLQNASRAIAWTLFDNRDELPSRIYGFNAAFGKLAPQVLQALTEELELDDALTEDSGEGVDDFDIDIEDDGNANYDAVIAKLKDGKSEESTVQALIEVCESAIERDKGIRSAKAALKTLSQAHSKLAGADVSMAGAATLPAMIKQITSIRDVLDKIEEKIELRLAAGNDSDASQP